MPGAQGKHPIKTEKVDAGAVNMLFAGVRDPNGLQGRSNGRL
jgi:hypothetical protein